MEKNRRNLFLDEQAVQRAAIAEILHPTFPTTQQFLATNQLRLKEQVPIVADIIFRTDEQVAEVYFPLEGERYYFVVTVDVEPQVAPRWTGMSAGNRVYFCATSQEHHWKELVSVAGMEPTRTWEKGMRRRHHGFEVQLSPKETGEVEDKLETLINFLLPSAANIPALSALAHVGIHIAYWGYKDQMWGLYFGTDLIQGLAALNLSVDVDLYAGGPDFGEP